MSKQISKSTTGCTYFTFTYFFLVYDVKRPQRHICLEHGPDICKSGKTENAGFVECACVHTQVMHSLPSRQLHYYARPLGGALSFNAV